MYYCVCFPTFSNFGGAVQNGFVVIENGSLSSNLELKMGMWHPNPGGPVDNSSTRGILVDVE